MTHWALGHVGLARPYRFERALAALPALLLGAIAGAAALFFYLTGRLSADSRRELPCCGPWIPRYARDDTLGEATSCFPSLQYLVGGTRQ